MRRVLVAGATGFVGRHVCEALLAEGFAVVAGTRRPERAPLAPPGQTWVHLDVDDPATLGPALAGCDAAVYLVHAMAEHDQPGPAERAAAEAFRAACEDAGIRRIVYLGGPRPAGPPSPHLASRLETGEVLRGGAVSTVELRAAMIVGAGSESWTICRDLAFRLPVMVLPSWLGTRSQPIWVGDVVRAIVRAVDVDLDGSAAFDLPGPEVLSARAILERVAAARGMRPLMIPVPVLSPRLSSYWLRGVTRADIRIARQLVEGLRHDMICADDGFWALAPDLERTPFDEAVQRALADEAPPERRRARVWEQVAAGLARHRLTSTRARSSRASTPCRRPSALSQPA
ncbi:MAG: NAD(P)H-binding protein [Alphaproteobacteria bacterium]|nr:NAD(P)H-binding protein [Alphaproteobacteria bacterium]